jgi:hypothetical protein
MHDILKEPEKKKIPILTPVDTQALVQLIQANMVSGARAEFAAVMAELNAKKSQENEKKQEAGEA